MPQRLIYIQKSSAAYAFNNNINVRHFCLKFREKKPRFTLFTHATAAHHRQMFSSKN